MKRYLLPTALTLLIFLGACSQKTNVSKVDNTTLPDSFVVIDEMPKMIIVDSVIKQDTLNHDTSLFINYKNACHPWVAYCFDVTCRCCDICIVPPIHPPWDTISYPWIIFPDSYNWILFTDTCLPDPDVTYFKPTGSLLLHLKTWQDVTGVQHRPIVATLCRQAGFTFIGDIV